MADKGLACAIRTIERGAMIDLFGNLTISGVLKLAEALHAARLGNPERIILNLEGITALDTTGFAFLRSVQVSSGVGARCEVQIRGIPESLLGELNLRAGDVGLVAEWVRPATQPGAPWVLVVDDEEQVLKYLVRFLGEAGFHVLQAAGVDEAISEMKRHAGKAGLALVDYQLGIQSGARLAERLAELQPGIRIILLSGQSSMEDGEIPGVRRRLHKPIFGAQLLDVIREVMEEP